MELTFSQQVGTRIMSLHPKTTLGYSEKDFQRILEGDLWLSPRQLEKIANDLNVSVKWLICGEA